jgi:hypothetical protein
MAATVELIDGFRYEIAGSVQFPTPSEITKDLGLDTLPTVDADVMSVNIGEAGEEAMIFYRDPMELMTTSPRSTARTPSPAWPNSSPGAKAPQKHWAASTFANPPNHRRDVRLRHQ